jgi:hypothetical protein
VHSVNRPVVPNRHSMGPTILKRAPGPPRRVGLRRREVRQLEVSVTTGVPDVPPSVDLHLLISGGNCT